MSGRVLLADVGSFNILIHVQHHLQHSLQGTCTCQAVMVLIDVSMPSAQPLSWPCLRPVQPRLAGYALLLAPRKLGFWGEAALVVRGCSDNALSFVLFNMLGIMPALLGCVAWPLLRNKHYKVRGGWQGWQCLPVVLHEMQCTWGVLLSSVYEHDWHFIGGPDVAAARCHSSAGVVATLLPWVVCRAMSSLHLPGMNQLTYCLRFPSAGPSSEAVPRCFLWHWCLCIPELHHSLGSTQEAKCTATSKTGEHGCNDSDALCIMFTGILLYTLSRLRHRAAFITLPRHLGPGATIVVGACL